MKKNIVLSILLLSVLLTGALLSYGAAVNIPQTISRIEDEDIRARMMSVAPKATNFVWSEQELEDIRNKEHIEAMFFNPWQWIDTLRCNYGSFTTCITGAEESMLPTKVVNGKIDTLQDYEIIIPSTVKKSSGSMERGETFLGKDMCLTIDVPIYEDAREAAARNEKIQKPTTISLRVVGVYDETSGIYGVNQSFTTMNTVKEIWALSEGNRDDFAYYTGTYIGDSRGLLLVLADSYESKTNLAKEFIADGYQVSEMYDYDKNFQTYIAILFLLLSIAILGLSFFLSLFVVKHNVLLKSSGNVLQSCSAKALQKSMAREELGTFFMALLMAVVVYRCVYPVIDEKIFSHVDIAAFSNMFLMGVCAIVVMYGLVVYVHMRKIPKSSLMKQVEYNQQLFAAQKEYHNNLAMYHQRVRQLHHDMNNHFLILYNALKQEDSSQAVQYIEKHMNLLSQSQMTYTGYLLLDTVLDYKKQIADAQHTEFLVRVQIPSDLNLAESLQNDFAMMLASCIDNALEATAQISDEANRWIKITLKHDAQYLHCKIENSAAKDVSLKEGELPPSSKAEGIDHGIGLKQVTQLAERHGGCLTLSCEANVFTASFMVEYEKYTC